MGVKRDIQTGQPYQSRLLAEWRRVKDTTPKTKGQRRYRDSILKRVGFLDKRPWRWGRHQKVW